jgi:hypothetical protein
MITQWVRRVGDKLPEFARIRGKKLFDEGSARLGDLSGLCAYRGSLSRVALILEVFRSLDLSWDLGIEFSSGVLGPWHAHQLPVSDAV